jgi:signal transduction histidine kinase
MRFQYGELSILLKKYSPKISLFQLLFLVLILVACVPVALLSVFVWGSYYQDLTRLEEESQATNQQIADLASKYMNSLVDEGRNLVRMLAYELGPKLSPEESWLLTLENSKSRMMMFKGVEIVDSTGRILFSTLDKTRQGSRLEHDYLLEKIIDERELSGEYAEKCHGFERNLIIVGTAIEDERGRLLGSLLGYLDPQKFHAEISTNISAVADRHVYAVDPRGRIIFYSDLKINNPLIRTNPPVKSFVEGKTGPISYISVVSGKKRLAVTHRTIGTGWGVIVSIDETKTLLPVRERYLGLALSFGLGLLIAIALSYLAGRLLVRPIKTIQHVIEKRSSTSLLPTSISEEGINVKEYRGLIRSFNIFIRRLHQRDAELVRAEKMATLGQLASGIAHQIGTPLNVIAGNAEIVLMKMEPDNPARARLEKIIERVDRISEMITRLLALSKPGQAEVADVDLNELIAQVLDYLPQLPPGISIILDLQEDLPPIVGSPVLLEQVLLNLTANAIQAMGQTGRLSIISGQETTTEEGLETSQETGEQWLSIFIVDTGSGITRENLSKLFTPFFTTKRGGEGTGLGLALAQRIVAELKGEIGVVSEENVGSVFFLRLKAARGNY